jgi:signal transduction histidine kinase
MSQGVDAALSPQLLADAFSEFIAASSVLESSYRDLQREVAHLGSELAQRNAALSRSLEENDRMRAALQQILDSMPCGVLVLNRAKQIVMINPEGRRLLDLGNAQIKNLEELSQASQIDLESLEKRQMGPFEIEIAIESVFGKRWLAVSHRRLACASIHIVGSEQVDQLQNVWILRDITANKKAEEERESVRRATALAEISTILAHEIKNPLASMELFAGLIEQEPDDAAEWIAHLRAGVRTLSGTVNNVLSLNNESSLRLSTVRLADCVEGGVEFVKPIAEQAGVSLSFAAKGREMRVLANEDAIRQIILNIVCNAIRHTDAGGKVSVSLQAAQRNGHAIVTIEDSGCGMSESVLARVFDTGFSGTGETSGLGLAVCKRLMEHHRGAIRVSSQVSQGTIFELEFPTL